MHVVRGLPFFCASCQRKPAVAVIEYATPSLPKAERPVCASCAQSWGLAGAVGRWVLHYRRGRGRKGGSRYV
jgi:hypothetical protein